ncbi:MAG: 2-C-methyl-D-erythritol 4-phosphate cytidylyltransferase [candidate division WOR-3 bacterium]
MIVRVGMGRNERAECNYGIVLAAGRGRRFGGLKQFVPVRGKPLFFYSLKAFENCPVVTGFVIVTNRSRVNQVKRWVKRWRFKKVIAVVAGGAERMDSVENGIFALPENGYVAIHDGVRPFIKPEMLTIGFRMCQKFPAVAFGVPVTDTLKEVVANRITQTIDRSGLVAIHTPQFFALNLIRRAYAQARNQKITASDDCELVQRLGISPRFLLGSSLNIKVTTRDDLNLCQALLSWTSLRRKP